MGDIKTIKVPGVIGEAGGYYDFLSFMWWLINTQSKFFTNGFGIRLGRRLEKQLQELTKTVGERLEKKKEEVGGRDFTKEEINEFYEGMELKLDKEDHVYVSGVAENPDVPPQHPELTYQIQPARRLEPFLEALKVE